MAETLTTKKNRIWEIDFLRGIAFICMVYDHAVYDLNYIFGVRTNFFWGYGDIIGNFSAITFMILCGISANFSKSNLKRGVVVFASALCLTAGTALIDGLFKTKLIIVFGILHFLGLAMIISHFVKKLPIWVTAIFAVTAWFVGEYFLSVKLNTNIFFMFGLYSRNFYSSDYYPLLPYLAFVFLGIILGKLLYKEKKSLFPFEIGKNPISFFGKHSFVLYFIHQPIVFAVLFIITKVFDLH